MEKAGQFKVDYSTENIGVKNSNADKDLLVFRILQEILNNIIKHAFATQIKIKLDCRECKLQLTVEDNGVGFCTGDVPGKQEGMGLQNIRKRAALMGGEVNIRFEPGTGTFVALNIPYPWPNMKTDRIPIAIVDDHTLFRKGVVGLMAEFKELEVIFEAANGKQMQEALVKFPLPKVMLMDINMPVMDGYETTCWLKSHYPQIHVLALSMFEDDEAVIKMIRCGACGYILKESKPRDLLEAIKIITVKGVYINEMVSGKLIRSVATRETAPNFSQKELDFLKHCCSELTYKEIADLMFVSPRTVDNYRESLFQKLNIKSRTGLVLYAIRNNLYHVTA